MVFSALFITLSSLGGLSSASNFLLPMSVNLFWTLYDSHYKLDFMFILEYCARLYRVYQSLLTLQLYLLN